MTVALEILRRKTLGRESDVEFPVREVDVPGGRVVGLVVVRIEIRFVVRHQIQDLAISITIEVILGRFPEFAL